MARSDDGTVTETPRGHRLRFERHLAHPIEEVWAAITQPERIGGWLAHGAEIDLRVGGRIWLGEDDGSTWIESTISELEPPELIAYDFSSPDWDEGGTLRWELASTADGTRLVLTHDVPRLSEAEQREFAERLGLPDGWEQLPSTLAGWHTILDRLPVALDRVGGAPSTDPSSFMSTWETLNEHYKRIVKDA